MGWGPGLGYGHDIQVEAVMESHKSDFMPSPSLEDIVEVDTWARKRVDEVASKINFKVPASA